MTSFSLLAPAIARDVLDHALALGADFAELFVERKRRSQLSLLSSQIENISGGLDFGHHCFHFFIGHGAHGFLQ